METKLNIRVGLHNERSVLTDCYFTSPLKVGTPNYEDDRMKIVLMMASAGILKGDYYSYDIKCDAGTKALLMEQSYTKVFDTGVGRAKKEQTIQLGSHASLIYRSSPVIPFANSTYDGCLTVKLAEHSEFLYTDILSVGRVGMGECLAFRHYHNRVQVKIEDRLVWLDQCLLEPTTMNVNGMLFYDGYTHQGTLYYYGDMDEQTKIIENIQKRKEITGDVEHIHYGITRASKGICLRVLAYTAQDIEELFDEVINCIY